MGLDVSIDPEIAARYDVKDRLGEGVRALPAQRHRRIPLHLSYVRQAYGIVFRAIPRGKDAPVALKKIVDAFRNVQDSQRTMREVCATTPV